MNCIVTVVSEDGVLTTAAAIAAFGLQNPEIVFTQAFQVDKINVSDWSKEKNILFVDLAVNHKNPQMTADFITKINVWIEESKNKGKILKGGRLALELQAK